MKFPYLFLISVTLLYGSIAVAQDDHYSEDSLSVYYENCMFNSPDSLTKDNDFFCSCSTYRICTFFTKTELHNLTNSSPKAYLINRCEEMANEFGTKPERSPDLEWLFILTDGNSEMKLTQDGVYYTTASQGNGPKPQPGQTVTIECELGVVSANEFIFSTIKDGKPLTFEVGKNTMIKGLELGVQLFGKGGEGYIFLPSKLGYGASDRGAQLPANSDLICHIKILDIN